MKKKESWLCSECGHDQIKWSGSCSACKQWNTIRKFSSIPEGDGSRFNFGNGKPPLKNIEMGGHKKERSWYKKNRKESWFCSECGHDQIKWSGSCSACKQWNTIRKFSSIPEDEGSRFNFDSGKPPSLLKNIEMGGHKKGGSWHKKKRKESWFCSECGYDQVKWSGSCSACKQWNTIRKFSSIPEDEGSRFNFGSEKPSLLKNIEMDENGRERS